MFFKRLRWKHWLTFKLTHKQTHSVNKSLISRSNQLVSCEILHQNHNFLQGHFAVYLNDGKYERRKSLWLLSKYNVPVYLSHRWMENIDAGLTCFHSRQESPYKNFPALFFQRCGCTDSARTNTKEVRN